MIWQSKLVIQSDSHRRTSMSHNARVGTEKSLCKAKQLKATSANKSVFILLA